MMSELQGTSNVKPDYSALIDSTLKTSGNVEVVGISFYRNWESLELAASIHFEPTRRNITTLGPRDVTDPYHVIYANEPHEEYHYVVRYYGPNLEIPDDSVEECLNITRQLYQILPTTPFRYTFDLHRLQGEEIRNLIAKCLVGDYEKITFCGRFYCNEALGHDEINILLNLVKPDTYFEFNSNIQNDFKHEKAFQFKSFSYQYAEWVALDDLKSLRNHDFVRFGKTKFSNEDFNKFLKYWTECDEPMMNTLTARIAEVTFHFEELNRNGDRKTLDEELDEYKYFLQNRIENKCDPEIILADLKYFTPIPRWTDGRIAVIHYLKSNTPGKCAELRIYEKRIEFHTEMSTFSHKNVEQMMTITDELEDLLKEKSGILDDDSEEKNMKERRENIETKIEELKKKIKEFGFFG